MMNLLRSITRTLLGRRLPLTEGSLEVSAINRPVLIRRDRYGIPYIEAQSDEDAWYGLGFCQGQDRAFQVEVRLRAARGTLAALIGPGGLPIDRLSRRIGIRHAAERQLEVGDARLRGIAKAFAQGVTDGMTLGSPQRAHEFALLQAKPTPFEASDTLGILKLMCVGLSSNWGIELTRLKLLLEEGPEALMALDPTFPAWKSNTDTSDALLQAGEGARIDAEPVNQLTEDLAQLTAALGQSSGSNNWVIAASRTATGRPIMANDPHLSPDLPPHWYLAHIRTPEWAVAGAVLAGTLGFILGHNDVAAWGVTAGLVDDADLFIEEIGPDGRSVREGKGFVPCEARREVIQVRWGRDVVEEVLVTPRGSIISPALNDLEAGDRRAIALRAVWLEPRPIRGVLQVHTARSFETFRRNFEQWPELPLNMVYADTSGTIGWQLVGEAPQRHKGWGTLPLPGWDSEVGWEEATVPFDAMPHLSNPESGLLATANNRPLGLGQSASMTANRDYVPFLGADWLNGYRQERIVESLAARRDWDLKSTQRLQMDQFSIPWRELRDLVLSLDAGIKTTAAERAKGKPGDEIRCGLDLLAAWDGVMAADSPAAAVFECFVTEMIQRVVQAKAPLAAPWVLGKRFAPLLTNLFSGRYMSYFINLLEVQPAGWFARPWPEELADALASTIRRMRQEYGDDPQRWAWGRIRPLTLRHQVADNLPLGWLFNLGPFPWGGDTYTVGQASAGFSDPLHNPGGIASLRIVVDVGNWEETYVSLPGGQSGNPLSPHYADMLPFWLRGEGVRFAWSPEAVAAATVETLRLLPPEA